MCTKHKNLTWTPMLLLLSCVLCKVWKVEYGQQNICALKGSSVVIPCSFYYPNDLKVQSVKWGHQRNNIYRGPFIYDSESNNDSSRFQYIGNKHHNCSLKIQQVEHNDTGKHAFRFTTNSKVGQVEEWTGSVGSQLKVVDLKIMVTKTNGNETTKEGDSVKLTCTNECDSRDLSSSFTWFKNVQHIHDGPILHLNNISSTNSGNYACSLKTQRRLTSEVINIDPEYGPKNTSVSVRPSTEVDVGSNITLICSTTANPTVEHYTWFKRGHDDMIVGNGPELNFMEIYPHDSGQYLCRVINKHGHQNSSIVTIKVNANWPTFIRVGLIIGAVGMLIVTTVLAVRRFSKKNTRAPVTTPETDCMEDTQNTIYINWPVFENSQSETENRHEGISTEIIYATVDFNSERTSNMQQQRGFYNNDEGVIYSTLCRANLEPFIY